MKVFFGSIKKKVKGERLLGYLNKDGLSINNNLAFYATSNNHLLILGIVIAIGIIIYLVIF